MGVKYRLDFQNLQGYDCRIDFDFVGYFGDVIMLKGGVRPFVLGEFNTDNDLFKPIRPQQATIEILANDTLVKMEDFLSDNDRDIMVRFDFGPWLGYWYGYLSQEDLQEEWIDQDHILTLRADEAIGGLRNIELQSAGGQKLIGVFNPLNYLSYAASKSRFTSLRSHIISNLFHYPMNTDFKSTGLDQCYIDARTFEQSPNSFDDSYTVIEKINRSWNQTLFQWDGEWWIVRIPELFISPDENLYVINNDRPTLGNRTSTQTRFDIKIGVNEKVKPIAPAMIKTLQKPSKGSRVNFDWVYHSQIIQNIKFIEGEFVNEVDAGIIRYELRKVGGVTSYYPVYGTSKYYTVSLWGKYNFISPETVSSAPMGRVETYENGRFVASSAYVGGGGTVDQALKSTSFRIEQGDKIRISVTVSTKNYYFSNDQLGAVHVRFTKDPATGQDALIKNLKKDGTWADAQMLWVEWGVSESSYIPKEINVESEAAPFSGTCEIYLVNYLNFERGINVLANYEVLFKDLNVELKPGTDNIRKVLGDYDKYTIAKNVEKNQTDTVYLDDAYTNTHKGCLLRIDGVTRTGDNWFRRKFDEERFTFKRQNALAKWFINRSYKTKLDINAFGLVWERSGSEFPIGLINTVIFVDDAPNKVFAITNLREIDFMNCTWTASLIEIFDTTVVDNEPTSTDIHTFDLYYE